MNFRIIAHLVRTDWQRLRRPVIALWIILIFTALPWLLHQPGDFQPPLWTGGGWNSRLGPVPEGFTDSPWNALLIHSLEMLATILSLALAAMLGAQWVKQPVTPIRGRERLVALALSLLVFLVMPQWILAFGNLLLHGFTPGIAALAAASPALTAWMLLGLAAALGAWLPSPWLQLAGCAALASGVGFISQFCRSLDFIFTNYPMLPVLPAGPKEWLLGALAILLLALLFPVFRQRLNGPWKIAVVVLLILAAGVPAVLFPPPDLQVKNDPSIDTDSIRPVLQAVRMTEDPTSRGSPVYYLNAELDSIGCPPGYSVRYVPTAGWISQDGKPVAALRLDDDSLPSFRDSYGYFQPSTYGEENPAALAALSGDRNPVAPAMRRTTSSTSLGKFELLPGTDILPGRIAELHMDFTAFVYRFEKVWDVPLLHEVTTFREGNLIWRVRRDYTKINEPRADVMVTHPALGLSNNPDENHLNTPIIFSSWLYFHLPSTGTNIRAVDRLMSASGPLFSGAGWDRAIIAPSNMYPGKAYLAGLRLLRLKPVIVVKFTTQTVTRFRPWMNDGTSDYALIQRSPVSDEVYRRDLFPERPDPQTCSREEFARWLRIPASMYSSPTNGSARDLSQYAPLFAGLMAKVADLESGADALRLGAPESLKDEVIEKIESLERPDRLAEVAMDRGWLAEAREAILGRFAEGGMWQTDAVMTLEEPSTYPVLISRFLERPERDTYEKLRLLPGIEPQLGEAIAKARRETIPKYLQSNLNSYQNQSPYGPFLYAAKRGDSEALETVLSLYLASGDKAEYTPNRDLNYVLSIPELPGKHYQAVAEWLRGKSAASFRFDPLLRLWKPLP